MNFLPEVVIKKKNNSIISVLINGEEWNEMLVDASVSTSHGFGTELHITIPCGNVTIIEQYGGRENVK